VGGTYTFGRFFLQQWLLGIIENEPFLGSIWKKVYSPNYLGKCNGQDQTWTRISHKDREDND
jgi:hypothetical protein